MSEASTTGQKIFLSDSWTSSSSSEDVLAPVGAHRTSGIVHSRVRPAARNAALSLLLVAGTPFAEIATPDWWRRKLQTSVSYVAIADDEHVFSDDADVESVWGINPKRPTLWLVGYDVPLLPRRRPFIVLSNDEDE